MERNLSLESSFHPPLPPPFFLPLSLFLSLLLLC